MPYDPAVEATKVVVAMAAFFILLFLAVVLGFAAHRASVCTVRAVAEVFHARTGYMFASVAKSILWILLITLPVFFLAPSTGTNISGWQLTAGAVAGGFIFGLGAGVNGACAYSTMARLVDGEGAMLTAIVGFAIGVLAFAGLAGLAWVDRPAPAPAEVGSLFPWALGLAGILLLVAIFEAVRLWRTRPPGGLRKLILAPQYRLSTAAMLIGLSGAAIFLLFGSAGYSSTFELVVEGAIGTRPWPTAGRWLLLLAVLFGMLLSTLQRGTFRLDFRPQRGWLRNLLGGVLMGLGVALAPGGNDALVLYGIPSLSPHALPTYLALAAGVAAAIFVMRAWLGIEMRAECRNDVFYSDWGLGTPERSEPSARGDTT